MEDSKLFYTISQTASILKETAVTVRFWSNTFPKHLKPRRNAKGNRFYTPKDIDTLRKIKYLSRDCGLSLDAVEKKLSKTVIGEDKTLSVRDSLLRIKAELERIRESL